MNTNKYQNENNLCECQNDCIQMDSGQYHLNPETNTEENRCINDGVGIDVQSVQPMSGFTVTLHGNGGTIGGAVRINQTFWHPISVADLPLIDLPRRVAGFLGWSFSATGPVLHPFTIIENNVSLFARHMTRRELAQEILDRADGRSATGRRITLGTVDGTPDGSGLSPRDNLRDTAAGLASRRAPMSGGTSPVPIGGTVFLSEHLLRSILRVNDRWGNVRINALTGARHSPTSRHYQGMAVDFRSTSSVVDGTGVQASVIIADLRAHRFNPGIYNTGAATGGSYSMPGFFHLEGHAY